VRYAVDYRRTIHGPGVGLSRLRLDVAVHPRDGQFAGGLQPAVGCPDNPLGVETHKCVVGQVFKPMAQEFPIFSNGRSP